MRAWVAALALSGPLLLAGGLAASGCSKAKPSVAYAGKELPPLVGAEQVRLFAGRTPPEEHTVIGVVTARCETINDSAGVLAGPCSHPAMRDVAMARAAAVGGTGLLDLSCNKRQMEREFSRQDGGQTQIDIRHLMMCRATVVRGPVDVAAQQATAKASVSAPKGARTITINDIELVVSIAPAEGRDQPLARPARKPEEVGELNAVPEGVVRLASVSARCLRGCARNVPQRALRTLAAELGALAIADKSCQLTEDRWQCSATALDEPRPGDTPPEAIQPQPSSSATAAPQSSATAAPQSSATAAPQSSATAAPQSSATAAPQSSATASPQTSATAKP